MQSRRAVLSLAVGGTLSLAGCDGPSEGTERDFGLTTIGAEGVPGQAVGVEVTASGVGVLTYRIDALPSDWQVTRGDFDPSPTTVTEMYPPELRWESSIATVTGSFIVEIPSEASGGEYSLPIEARAGDSEETVVSTAIITVDGPTDTRSSQEPAGTPSTTVSTGSPSTADPATTPSPRRTG